ncbi:MAG: methylated-DNA--[protein]-cysteine S-methyltransferase [Acidimicrobiales bacterium]
MCDTGPVARMRSACIVGTTTDTPCGRFSILANNDGVLAAGFVAHPEDLADSLGFDHDGFRIMDAPRHQASLAVQDYMEGDLAALARIPVIQMGTLFTKSVLRALARTPAGNIISYQALAERAGNPAAQRAAGSACARNKIAIFIPCHRAIPADGTLGRYAYGSERKAWLLQHEGAQVRW